MNYFVIAPDGQKYGPADIEVLNQWIREGRLYPATLLEPTEGGPQVPASSVSGLNFPGQQATAYAQPTPSGMASPMGNAGTPFPGTQGTYAQYPRTFGSSSDVLPEEVKKRFNWGAFFFSWIWGLNHKQPILLLALLFGCIPYLGVIAVLGMQIWAGLNGNQWAWQSGRFSTVDDMENCQVIWAKWALGVLIAYIVIIVLAIAFPMMAQIRR